LAVIGMALNVCGARLHARILGETGACRLAVLDLGKLPWMSCTILEVLPYVSLLTE
jgi:hypothetical protein